MQSKAKSPIEYIEQLPEDRRLVVSAVRKALSKFWPKGLKEQMQYGMISYVIPLSKYPNGYLNDPSIPLTFAAIASQKNHYAIYLMSIYNDVKLLKKLQDTYKAKGMKLDMGKSCIRFKKLDQVDLDVIGKVIQKTSVEDYIKEYEKAHKKK